MILLMLVVGAALLVLGVHWERRRKQNCVTVSLLCRACNSTFTTSALKETTARGNVRIEHRASGCKSTMYAITRKG